MTIEEFANRYNVRLRRDWCGDMIAGKPPRPRPEDCSHIFEMGDGRLGLCLILGSPRRWTFAKRRLLAAGFELKQDGDSEGTFLFDPNSDLMCRMAIKEAGIRAKNRVTPEDRAQRAARMAEWQKGRLSPSAEPQAA